MRVFIKIFYWLLPSLLTAAVVVGTLLADAYVETIRVTLIVMLTLLVGIALDLMRKELKLRDISRAMDLMRRRPLRLVVTAETKKIIEAMELCENCGLPLVAGHRDSCKAEAPE